MNTEIPEEDELVPEQTSQQPGESMEVEDKVTEHVITGDEFFNEKIVQKISSEMGIDVEVETSESKDPVFRFESTSVQVEELLDKIMEEKADEFKNWEPEWRGVTSFEGGAEGEKVKMHEIAAYYNQDGHARKVAEEMGLELQVRPHNEVQGFAFMLKATEAQAEEFAKKVASLSGYKL